MCEAEVKENLAKLRMETASQQFDFHFQDPCMATIQSVQSLARKYGVKRLSRADESLIGLALEMVGRGEKVKVYTDIIRFKIFSNGVRFRLRGFFKRESKRLRLSAPSEHLHKLILSICKRILVMIAGVFGWSLIFELLVLYYALNLWLTNVDKPLDLFDRGFTRAHYCVRFNRWTLGRNFLGHYDLFWRENL